MPHLRPRPLAENDRLAYAGERIVPAFGITARVAAQMLPARNPHGKPNSNVLREVVSAPDFRRLVRGWQIDFPPDMSEEEAALYENPFHHLVRTVRLKHERWWANPYARHDLRVALARRERYLATPLGGATPEFVWLDAQLLPDSSLLVVARDDDFAHGVLRSRAFALWWSKVHSRRTPTVAVESFPFPWPPRTELHALTAVQEAHRHAVALAARGDDAARLETAVAVAYGWPAELPDAELLARLSALNQQRG
ncbi:MAG: hypothetical protein HY302_06165 [Opitutae bacterium]|nr:hypothetical protein [Opitutae bacterium]